MTAIVPPKILVVEDDSIVGSDIARMIESFGYGVVGPVSTGEEAVDLCSKGPIDLVLMDIGLAGKLDGIQASEKISKIKNPPIVFLSALSDEHTLQRVKLTKPFGFIIKPFDEKDLRAVVELTLHRAKSDAAQADEDESLVDFDSSLANSASLAAIIAGLPLFHGVESEIITNLSAVASVKEFDSGSFVVHDGEQPSFVFIPLSGRISVTMIAESGKELITALLAPGDPFGVFYSLPAFTAAPAARVQTTSKVVIIDKKTWSASFSKSLQLTKNVCAACASRLSASFALSSSLAHAKVEGRIINTLLALLPVFGKNSGKDTTNERIFITRKELSELTGTTPETAIRVTKNLERSGLLDLTRPGIIKVINRAKLTEHLAN